MKMSRKPLWSGISGHPKAEAAKRHIKCASEMKVLGAIEVHLKKLHYAIYRKIKISSFKLRLVISMSPERFLGIGFPVV